MTNMHSFLDKRRLAILREMGIPVWVRPQRKHIAAADIHPSTRIAQPPTAQVVAVKTQPPPQKPPDDTELQTDTAAQIAHMDWTQLQKAMRTCPTCQACSLYQESVQAVFGQANTDTNLAIDIFILGDVPDASEDTNRRAFVGKNGVLLTRMLQALAGGPKHPLPKVYMTHAVKCRTTHYPSSNALSQCRAFWQRQVELLQPQTILALGRFAAQALTESPQPLGQLRNRVHTHTTASGKTIPVVVSYATSHLLHSPVDKARVWADLCLLRQQLEAKTAHVWKAVALR